MYRKAHTQSVASIEYAAIAMMRMLFDLCASGSVAPTTVQHNVNTNKWVNEVVLWTGIMVNLMDAFIAKR
jgi:hypothetical protein